MWWSSSLFTLNMKDFSFPIRYNEWFVWFSKSSPLSAYIQQLKCFPRVFLLAIPHTKDFSIFLLFSLFFPPSFFLLFHFHIKTFNKTVHRDPSTSHYSISYLRECSRSSYQSNVFPPGNHSTNKEGCEYMIQDHTKRFSDHPENSYCWQTMQQC